MNHQAGQPAAAATPSCVVVGSCIVDFCVSVPRLPGLGETVIASGLERSLGGKGANQATALRRLGGEVALVAAVGRDDFGEAFRDFLRGEGVGTSFVERLAAAPTGVAFPMVLPDGGNAIVAAPAASLALTSATVAAAAAAIASADALLLSLEVPEGAALAAMAVARHAGRPIFLNPAPCTAFAARLAARADVLIPNQVEAAALAGTPPIETPADGLAAAERLLAKGGPQVVVVTLGAAGAALCAPGCRCVVPAFPIAAVDPTGAGDAFCAGLVDARCRGADWPQAVEVACACGALACRGKGAIPWLPTAGEVRDFRSSMSVAGA